MKVFSGCAFIKGVQVHAFLAATSQKRCAELLQTSVNYVRGYWGVTGNSLVREIALESPETIFYWKKGTEYSGKRENIIKQRTKATSND